MKLLKHLARLGYGSRNEVQRLIACGRVTDPSGAVLDESAVYAHEEIRIDGAPLDPPPGVLLILHKPVGFTCSTSDAGRIVYDLLPPRFRHRSPVMSTVGRLDRDTSGLLLLTDDGALLHRIIHPRLALPKVYEATLARDVRGDEGALFASGELMLRSESTPLATDIDGRPLSPGAAHVRRRRQSRRNAVSQSHRRIGAR